MPKRQAARERARATVEAAAASAEVPLALADGQRSLLIRVSTERLEALEALAQGRSLDAVVADAIDDFLRKNPQS